jgi:hypothetical protein
MYSVCNSCSPGVAFDDPLQVEILTEKMWRREETGDFSNIALIHKFVCQYLR